MTLYRSPRNNGDVLTGSDTARPLIRASSSGNDTALWNLLSQPKYIEIILESPETIYSVDERKDGRRVLARPILNVNRCLMVAAENGHADVVTTLLTFAKELEIDFSNVITREVVRDAIGGGEGAVYKALAAVDSMVVNFHLPHGALPLYEAARRRKPDVLAALLELGADPLHPVRDGKEQFGFRSSLLSHAAFGETPRAVELLLGHGMPIAGTAALHTAAACGRLDTMRLLMQHGANVNEVTNKGYHGDWTPLHFAASRGQVEAMKLLEDHGASSDPKTEDDKRAAQILKEYKKNPNSNR